MRFNAICWEPGIVHILTEKQAKNIGFKQTLCGKLVPTDQEERSLAGDVRVCSFCRNVQDLVLRGHSPARARSILTHTSPRELKRGRHGGS